MTTLSRRPQRRRGAAAVELAVLLPVLAFLFVAAVDYPRVSYYSVTVENCARNGALYASDPVMAAQPPYASITAAAQAEAPNLSPAPSVSSASGTDGDSNPYVEVTVTWSFQTLTNYPGVPSTVTVSRTVRVRKAPTVPN